MSTLPGDFKQSAAPIDLDPLVGLQRPSPESPRPNEESGEERDTWKDDLCHAICVDGWTDVKSIVDQNPNALTAEIDDKGRTTLHVAAMFGHVTIVEELLKLLPPQFLLRPDSFGDTALVLASRFAGITQVAKCLVNKNSRIVCIPNKYGNLPVTVAFADGYQEMGRYLYSVTPLECLTGRWGSRLLRCCFHAQCFEIALNLLQQCEELLFMPANDEGWTPIREIATLNTTIIRPSELIFWKRWIYSFINHVFVDIQQQDRSQGDKAKLTELGKDPCVINVEVKKVQELKLLHAQADDLLHLVCKNARKAYQKRVIDEALSRAAKEGNVEFVLQVSNAIPEIFLRETMVSCFNKALDYRQAKVFNLIHGLRFKHGLATMRPDNDPGHTLMHKVAIKAPDHVLNRIYAPSLQMQRELQWFKEVESLTPPSFRVFQNKDGMTAGELFRESHKELMKQGEKWIKDTASSCSVVGTLIVTIMFAGAFTVPGGNDENVGYPLFIKQPFFKVFIFSTILSLLSSSTSVLMFLAILTSQYSEEKFLKSLPTKLILGLFFLFISIVSMIIAFLSTIRLMLKHTNYSWGLLPIIIFASVPIFLFVLSQFPLLLHTFVSTYGNIFDRKVKPWP
ncbi:uncharacterized protein LOC114721471 [Neltuma alba]|uniref:uncharacterized protein LOC114721471 n=1 Tax=Neltuma alba TaxID=207710 RepID=UPI0010A38990|nr:uncharacterized protein LOC114721471 [Prosopis alba]